MPTIALFKPRTSESFERVTVSFEGSAIEVRAGVCVAAALLAAGVAQFRSTPVTGAPRAPYCMMGVCFECLLEIDGVPNRQACQVEVAQGMRIRVQRGARGHSAELQP